MQTLYITPASPWENGYCESFNSKLRDELLAREIFYDLREAKALIEGWTTRPKRLRNRRANKGDGPPQWGRPDPPDDLNGMIAR